MSKLKELSEKAKKQQDKKGNNEPELSESQKYDFLYDTLFENSLSYLFGSIEAYFILNEKIPPNPDEISQHLKSIPQDLDTEEKRKKYFKESKNDIDKFLFWFFFERRNK